MSNELKTIFIFDDADANRRIDSTEKKLIDLDRRLNGVGQNPTFSRNLNTQFDAVSKSVNQLDSNLKKLSQPAATLKIPDSALKQAQADIKRYQNETIASEKAITRSIEREAKLQADAKIREQRRAANSLIQNAAPPSSGNFGGGFGGGFINRAVGSDFGSSAFVGGAAAGAIIAGLSVAKTAASALISEIKELSVESVRLAGKFEETTNAVAVFAGGAGRAKAELAAIDKVALDTPGLRLEDAETGYQRLRALNFQANISRDLIKGLGTQRVLSGASADSVDRVITNLIQLTSGAGTAADVRQTVGQLPTLLPVFKKAFGTQDFGEINKIAKENPAEFIRKFSAELAKAETAQAGLNVSIEKGSDALVQAGRIFGAPLLDPLTKDVQDLTTFLRENETVIEKWGRSAADTVRGVSDSVRALNLASKTTAAQIVGGAAVSVGRAAVNRYTGGASESLIGLYNFTEQVGKAQRLAEEAKTRNSAPSVSFTDANVGKFDVDPLKNTSQYQLDSLTNTIKFVGDLRRETNQLEANTRAAADAAEKLKKTSQELSELQIKFAIDDVSQDLEIKKAIAVRDAKGDALKLSRETAALEINALAQQIDLTNRLSAKKIENLSPEDQAAGRGEIIAQENGAAIAKLNNQISLVQINLEQKRREISKSLLSLKDDFRDAFAAARAADNPLVKQMTDFETATERTQAKFGQFGAEAVSVIARLEKANLSKAINQQKFQNQIESLKFAEDARRLADAPERAFADFARRLETINKTVDFTVQDNDLNRKIAETDYYVNRFNANNPLLFSEQLKRENGAFGGGGGDASALGTSIRAAAADIASLKAIDASGAGVGGKEAVVNKILELIPPPDALIKQMQRAPSGSGARDLLEERLSALTQKREIERGKFSDFLDDQKTAQFGKIFAREQISLINKSQLSDADKARQRLTVTDALGNDLDANLRRQRIQDFVAVGREAESRDKEALATIKELKAIVERIGRDLEKRGVNSESGAGVVNLSVAVENGDYSVRRDKNPTRAATASRYGGE